VVFLFHLLTKWEALSALFFNRINWKPCAPLVKMKNLFCLIKQFTLFHEICPKQSPNGIFVSLFDQIGSPVLPFFIEQIVNPVRRWLE
jgi:hypothetical protein